MAYAQQLAHYPPTSPVFATEFVAATIDIAKTRLHPSVFAQLPPFVPLSCAPPVLDGDYILTLVVGILLTWDVVATIKHNQTSLSVLNFCCYRQLLLRRFSLVTPRLVLE